jgi:alpha-L-rhamnosidase
MKKNTLILLSHLVLSTVVAQNGLKISNPLCEYLRNPEGIDITQPRFYWQLQSTEKAQKQSAYQIMVAQSVDDLKLNKGILWDSKKIVSEQSIHVKYEGIPLKSGEKAY